MEEPKTIYALCRKYERGANRDEKEIVVGLEKEILLTNTFDIFKTLKGEYVVRFEEVARQRGCVIGKITNILDQEQIRTIPVDDLVTPYDIFSGIR